MPRNIRENLDRARNKETSQTHRAAIHPQVLAIQSIDQHGVQIGQEQHRYMCSDFAQHSSEHNDRSRSPRGQGSRAYTTSVGQSNIRLLTRPWPPTCYPESSNAMQSPPPRSPKTGCRRTVDASGPS
eukprot:7094314-Pyramimonas_sp.AAC.1